MGNYIYLTRNNENIWSASISDQAPGADCVPFLKEGAYPVEIIYGRTDLNGSYTFESDTCQNREELLQTLNWFGQCGYQIMKLWDFDRQATERVLDIFESGAARRRRAIQEAARDLEAEPFIMKVIDGKERACYEVGDTGHMRMELDVTLTDGLSKSDLMLVPLSLEETQLEELAEKWITQCERERGLPAGESCSSSGWWVGSDDSSRDHEITHKYDHLIPSQNKSPTLTLDSDGITVAGHVGTWHVIDHEQVEGASFFLLEHDKYGDDAANLIVDSHANLILEDVWNGFDEETKEQLSEQVKSFTSTDSIRIFREGQQLMCQFSGEEQPRPLRSHIQDIRAGDAFLVGTQPYYALSDSHQNFDEPDNPWIVEDMNGDCWFEEDIANADRSTLAMQYGKATHPIDELLPVQHVTIVRERPWEHAIWSDHFWVDAREVPTVELFRRAVQSYLDTAPGHKAIEESCEDFNWGDAMTVIPESAWKNYGIYPIDYTKSPAQQGVSPTANYNPFTLLVNQDEILIPDSYFGHEAVRCLDLTDMIGDAHARASQVSDHARSKSVTKEDLS